MRKIHFAPDCIQEVYFLYEKIREMKERAKDLIREHKYAEEKKIQDAEREAEELVRKNRSTFRLVIR